MCKRQRRRLRIQIRFCMFVILNDICEKFHVYHVGQHVEFVCKSVYVYIIHDAHDGIEPVEYPTHRIQCDKLIWMNNEQQQPKNENTTIFYVDSHNSSETCKCPHATSGTFSIRKCVTICMGKWCFCIVRTLNRMVVHSAQCTWCTENDNRNCCLVSHKLYGIAMIQFQTGTTRTGMQYHVYLYPLPFDIQLRMNLCS